MGGHWPLPGVLSWETKDETPGPGTTCTINDVEEVGACSLPKLLNCSLFQTGPPAAHPIIFIHTAVHSHCPFLQHMSHLHLLKCPSPLHSISFRPTFPALSSKTTLCIHPLLCLCEALHEPTAQNSLLLPLCSGCTALSSDLVQPLPPMLDAKGQACY